MIAWMQSHFCFWVNARWVNCFPVCCVAECECVFQSACLLYVFLFPFCSLSLSLLSPPLYIFSPLSLSLLLSLFIPPLLPPLPLLNLLHVQFKIIVTTTSHSQSLCFKERRAISSADCEDTLLSLPFQPNDDGEEVGHQCPRHPGRSVWDWAWPDPAGAAVAVAGGVDPLGGGVDCHVLRLHQRGVTAEERQQVHPDCLHAGER